MDGTLKKVTINNPDEALRELTALKKQGKELKGSLIEKQIGDMVGDVPNIDIALSLLRNKLSAQKTDQVIDMVVDKAAIDPARKEAVRREAAKIVNQDEFKTEEVEVSDLAKVIAGDNQVTTETEITAKKIKTVLNEWEEDAPQSVRSYREERFKAEFMAKTEEENPDLTDKQRQAVKRKVEIVSSLYYSDGGIENQRQTVMETTRDESPGQVKNSWSDLQAVAGLMKLEPKATDKLIQENTKIESDLTGVKLPYDQFPQVRAYDDLNALVTQGSNLSVLKSIQNGGNLLGQTAKTVNRLTNGWIEKGAMKIVGNFASRIGNQAAAEFVKNSMGLLMQNGLKGSLGMILKGVAGTGVKTALGATGAAAGALTGPVGWAVTAAVFVKKLFNKTVGKLMEKLGLSSKKFLEENFGKMGGVIIKGLTALVALPTILLASTGIAIAGPIVIGAIVGLFVVNQYTASSLVSSLVPNIDNCDSNMEFVDTKKKPEIFCGNMTKYNNELKEKIRLARYQTRCAVAAAAQYLVMEFPYHISYSWGDYFYGDGISEEWCKGGMDCNSFIVWAYRQGGFAMVKSGRSQTWQGNGKDFRIEKIKFGRGNCGRIKAVAKPGDIVNISGVHKAIVIGVDGTRLQIAEEGSKGLKMLYVNICTGGGFFQEYWSMDNFFNYYTSGGKSINGFAIIPGSEIRKLPKVN